MQEGMARKLAFVGGSKQADMKFVGIRLCAFGRCVPPTPQNVS